MRRILPAFALGILALELMSLAVTAQVIPDPPPSLPPSLKTVRVPLPEELGRYVRDKAAAIALGKALFWDLQVGGDGQTACASCHFQAGADTRAINQLNPGANGMFDVGGPNHSYAANEFPFHQLADPDNRHSTRLRSKDDVSGSNGVHNSEFLDIVLGAGRDHIVGVPDPTFNVGGLNTRRVTGRNTPSMFNAVFNVRNFWDGRANRRFNGRNPFGDADVNARVLRVDDLGELQKVRLSINNASLSSQAVGPPNNNTEMSAAGRDWLKLGKKMLSLQPLGTQRVHADDSSLGELAILGGNGLNTTYADMIAKAFAPQWWQSNLVVDAALNVIPGVTVPGPGGALPTDQYSMMEANFSMFWGLAINLYGSTLVSDDTPYDRFAEGSSFALTPQQQFGLKLFMNSATGNCIACHAGAEFTGATFSARLDPITKDGMIERMIMGDRRVAVYDGGFYNIGVRPTAEDVGVGGSDPFGNPLSIARREAQHLGSVEDAELFPPMDPNERIAADGAFKTPTLRNVELNGPYFHNGSIARLTDVVDFYTRGGNFRDENMNNLDPDIHRVKGLVGRPNRKAALTTFLRSLTDERVRFNRAPFDHPEITLRLGAPGNEVSVLADLALGGQASDATLTLPATGRSGAGAPVQPFLGLPLFDSSPIPAPNPVYSGMVICATDTVYVGTRFDTEGDLWSNGFLRVADRSRLRTMHGDITAGGDIKVRGDSTVIHGSVMARGTASLYPPSGVTTEEGVVGSFVEFFAPLVLPTLPVVTAGSMNVTVTSSTTLRLPPGQYATVLARSNSKLILADGEYVFRNLTLQPGATLIYDEFGTPDALSHSGEIPDGPTEKTTINIVNDFGVQSAASITSGDSERSTHLRINVLGGNKTLRFGTGATFHGSLVAPGSRVVMADRGTLQGAIFARMVEIGDLCTIRPHHLPDDERVDLPLAGMSTPTTVPVGTEGFLNTSASDLGLDFTLRQNQPNPFRQGTVLRFALPSERDVRLEVFDVGGRMVKSLARGRFGPGLHTMVWNGIGDRGTRLPSGVYLYRLIAGKDVANRKLILMN